MIFCLVAGMAILEHLRASGLSDDIMAMARHDITKQYLADSRVPAHAITYNVFHETGAKSSAIVTYRNSENVEVRSTVSLPWRLKQTVRTGMPIGLSVQYPGHYKIKTDEVLAQAFVDKDAVSQFNVIRGSTVYFKGKSETPVPVIGQ